MSQYPGAQPPQGPYYGQPPVDPYGPAPQQPNDPYFGAPPADPYAPPQDPYYGASPYGSYGPPPGWYPHPQGGQPPRPEARRPRGSAGAAVFGLLLVLVGAWVLFGDQLDLEVDWGVVWPVAAVVLGILMVLASLIPRGGGQES